MVQLVRQTLAQMAPQYMEHVEELLCMDQELHNIEHTVQVPHELLLQDMVFAFFLYSKIAKYEWL